MQRELPEQAHLELEFPCGDCRVAHFEIVAVDGRGRPVSVDVLRLEESRHRVRLVVNGTTDDNGLEVLVLLHSYLTADDAIETDVGAFYFGQHLEPLASWEFECEFRAAHCARGPKGNVEELVLAQYEVSL